MPPKASRVEDRLAALSAVRADPRAPGAEDLLRKALSDQSSAVVASAATLVGDASLDALYPLLPPAFERFVPDGANTDKGCRAKQAIASALLKNEVEAASVFLTGVRIVQMEASWGPPVDTAGGLRGTCGMGLAMLDHPDALDHLSVLLADPQTQARAHAACALGNLGRAESIPLLRFKCMIGDEEAEVLSECFTSLLALRWASSLPFVASFLDSPKETTAEAAALALGESRRDEAFPILRDFAERARPGMVRTALLALGLLRSPAATEVLLGVVERAMPPTVAHALAALAIQRHDEALAERVREIVKRRKLRSLDQAFRDSFEG